MRNKKLYPLRTASVTPGAYFESLVPSTTTYRTATPSRFTYLLRRGSRGNKVTALQNLLARSADIYPEGLVTGYFGPLTEAAVKRFQIKYSIVASGDPVTTGYGLVGPKTRAKFNELVR